MTGFERVRSAGRPGPAVPAGTVAAEIRVERGAPTEEEVAAVVAVLLSRFAAAPRAAEPAAVPASRWARSARPWSGTRSPDAWRAAALASQP